MKHAQMRAFHAVARLGGFSLAAGHLGVTQPALSEQVRRLEQERDVQLFVRSRKGVTLTEAGERLYLLTKRYFEVEEEIEGYFSDRADRLRGHLRIVADSAHHVAHVLGPFRARHPEVQLELRSGNSAAIIDALRHYDAEIGVIGTSPIEPDLVALDLGGAPIIAFARRDLLAAAAPMSVTDLAAHPWVMREPGSRTRHIVETRAKALGLLPKIAVIAEGREAVRAVVLSGAGLGFVSRAEYVPDPRFVTVSIHDLPDEMPEALVHLKARGDVRLIRAFMAEARAQETLAPSRNLG